MTHFLFMVMSKVRVMTQIIFWVMTRTGHDLQKKIGHDPDCGHDPGHDRATLKKIKKFFFYLGFN
jgi:hypothetical protein